MPTVRDGIALDYGVAITVEVRDVASFSLLGGRPSNPLVTVADARCPRGLEEHEMTIPELEGLAHNFAEAFSKRDVAGVLGMLADDVEIFDHVPYRFDDRAQFAAYFTAAVSPVRRDELRIPPAVVSGSRRDRRGRERLRLLHGHHEGR